jgi:hypothetical protein
MTRVDDRIRDDAVGREKMLRSSSDSGTDEPKIAGRSCRRMTSSRGWNVTSVQERTL